MSRFCYLLSTALSERSRRYGHELTIVLRGRREFTEVFLMVYKSFIINHLMTRSAGTSR
jgi:hypothetical protein